MMCSGAFPISRTKNCDSCSLSARNSGLQLSSPRAGIVLRCRSIGATIASRVRPRTLRVRGLRPRGARPVAEPIR